MILLLLLLTLSLLTAIAVLAAAHVVRRDSRGWQQPPGSHPLESRRDALARR
ncbi:hypothetical protein [Nocardioides pacificus]